jgi:hypothetical protein
MELTDGTSFLAKTKTCSGDTPPDSILILPTDISERHCRKCDTTFGCKDCFATHLGPLREPDINPAALGPNNCPICGHLCKSEHGVALHSAAKHGTSAKAAKRRHKKAKGRTSTPDAPVKNQQAPRKTHQTPVKNDSVRQRIEPVISKNMGDPLVVAYNPTLGPVGEQFRRQVGRRPLEPKETLGEWARS